MRYLFHPNPAKPGYVILFDSKTSQPVLEMVDSHAQMLYLIYSNHIKFNGDQVANEFIYGHILGMVLAQIHAEKYVKLTVKKMDGRSKIVCTDPVTGDTSLQDTLEACAGDKGTNELFNKVIGKDMKQ